jgi:hypothetical protein
MAAAAYRYRILVTNSVPSPGGAANVFNVGNDALLTDANVTSILNHLKTFLAAQTTYAYGTWSIGQRVLEFRPGVALPRIVAAAPVVQALGQSTILPTQLAAVVSWRTAFAGKSYRGRTFLGPFNNTVLSANNLHPTFVTNMSTAATNLIANIKLVTNPAWGLVVHSDKLSEDTPVTTAAIDSRVDTLRSRG